MILQEKLKYTQVLINLFAMWILPLSFVSFAAWANQVYLLAFTDIIERAIINWQFEQCRFLGYQNCLENTWSEVRSVEPLHPARLSRLIRTCGKIIVGDITCLPTLFEGKSREMVIGPSQADHNKHSDMICGWTTSPCTSLQMFNWCHRAPGLYDLVTNDCFPASVMTFSLRRGRKKRILGTNTF